MSISVETIHAHLIEVRSSEKPSGAWREGESAQAFTGEMLSSRTGDPEFFLGGAQMRPEEREALLAANSIEEGPGLSWRDFSRARGYSPQEIEVYAQVLAWKKGRAWWEIAAAAGYECANDAFESEEGTWAIAQVLATLNAAQT